MSNTTIPGRRCAFGRILRPFIAACLAACATVAQSAEYLTRPNAIWSNIGNEYNAGSPDAQEFDNSNYMTLTIDFGVTNNIALTEIGGAGTVKISKIVFLKRALNAPTMPTTVTATQPGGKSVTGSIAEGTTARKIYASDYDYRQSNTRFWTATVEQTITFAEADATFDTAKPITLQFPSNFGVRMIKKPNGVLGNNNTWCPAVEVVGDYSYAPPRSISINFGNKGAVTGTYGVVPSTAWFNVTAAGNTRTDVPVYGSSALAKVVWSCNNIHQYTTGVTDTALKGYLDDGGNGISIEVSNIPFARYDVIVYQATDSGSNYAFNPPSINGTYYSFDGKRQSATRSDTSLKYGQAFGATATTGRNFAYVRKGFTGACTILGAGNANTARGCIAAIQIVESLDAYTTTISGNASFSGLTWTPAKTKAFTASDAIVITNEATSATLTLDEDITVGKMSVVSEAGKKLTFKKGQVSTSVGALDFSKAAEGVGFDARASGFTAGLALLDYARTHDERFFFYGSGANGALVDYGTAQNNYTFSGHYVFDGGTHIFQNCSESAGIYFGANATAENPTLWVMDNTTLYFKSRNPCGWNTYANTSGIVRVGNGAKVLAANSAIGTWYWSQQFYLDPGAVLEIATEVDKFRLNGGGGGDAPQIVMSASDGGTAKIISTAATNNLCIGDNNYSAAAVKVGAGSTLTISAAIKTLTDGKMFGKYGAGTLALTGDLGAFGAAITVSNGVLRVAPTAYLKSTATLTIAEGAKLVIDAGSGVITNRCRIVNNGTIEIGGGTVLFMPGTFNGAITTSGSGKALFGYTTDVNMLGVFPIPEGKTADQIRLFDRGGNAVPYTVDGDTLKFDWQITGVACWWDYEFEGNGDNAGTDGTKLSWDKDRPHAENKYDTPQPFDFNDQTNALKIVARPWRNVNSWKDTMTFTFFGKMVQKDMTYQLSFGSKNGGGNQLFVATHSVADGTVDLCYSVNGAAPTVLCTMNVLNAQTANHLYAFVLKNDGKGNSIVDTYLDGKLLQPYTHTGMLTLGAGFQIASGHGGIVPNYGRPDDSDPATVDWLRVYDTELSAEAMKKLAEKYPYVSSKGKATRTISSNGTWKQTNAWSQWSQDGVLTIQDAPDADTVVEMTMNGDAVVEMNLDAQANYEKFSIDGEGTLTLSQSTGAVAPNVVGWSAINANMTVDYRSFVFGGPVDVADGKTLTFDFAALDLGSYFSSATIKLTGMATLGIGAQVLAENIKQVAGRTAQLLKNAATGQYQLVITVQDLPFVYTINKGQATGTWTWNGVEVSAETVAAQTSGTIEKAGDGVAELAPQAGMKYDVKNGTLKFAQAATVDCLVTNVAAGAVLDLNGLECGSEQAAIGFVVTLGGGMLANSSANQAILKSLTLVADSTVDVSSGNIWIQSGSGGYAVTTLALGTRTLVKTGSGQLGVVTTTVTGTGTIDVREGELWVQESSDFGAATVKVGAAGVFHIRAGKTATVANVVAADGGVLNNEGTVSAFTLLDGTLAITNSGTYGAITLNEGAVVNMGSLRGLRLGGTGKVGVVLTAEEIQSSEPVRLFVPEEGSSVSLGSVLDEFGNDLTYKYRLDGGTITVCQAKIGDAMYTTLALAVEAVRDGQTIELLSPAVLSGTVTNAFVIDIMGYDLSCGNVDVKGAIAFDNSAAGTGSVSIGGVLSVSGGAASWIALNARAVAGGGSISIASGALVNEGVTALDGIDLLIGRGGRLDLSSGTLVRCRGFASSGEITGTNAFLTVAGTFDASVPVTLAKLALGNTAVLKGLGLVVTDALSLGNALRFRYNPIKEGLCVATVPAGTDVGGTSLFVNDEVTGGYAFYINPGDTALRIRKADEVMADVRLSVVPDTNEVNRVDFESVVLSGEVYLHGDESRPEVDGVTLIARASDGTVKTQKVSQVSGDGSFSCEFEGLDAGKAYVFSAEVSAVVSGQAQEVSTVGHDVDFVSARSIDGVGGWIYEDAKTFDGSSPGSGCWYGTNGVACATNDVIGLIAEDWGRSAEFQPTNMSLDITFSYVKDVHFHVEFDCPGFYLYEPWPGVTNSVPAAFTLVADADDNCYLAVVSNGSWAVISRDVFAPQLSTPYELLVRLDGVASNIQYSVVTGGEAVRLATCPVVASKDVSLDLTGSGAVSLIEGICQDPNLAQVGDEQYWTIDEAVRAAGGTNNIIPLWWSRYAVSGDGGILHVLDPNGYLQLIWQKWHHWRKESGSYRYISGNNWIEYADSNGVAQVNGAWLVTNEVGLAWIAEQATNQWFCGTVSMGADLDLSSKNWTPIAQYMGAFDGGGHTIRGLNNAHVIYTNLLGAAGYYFGGPSNDWGYTAYGLFGSATNATFANVTFEDVAISNVADSAAVLLGVHAGGDLAVSNVTVASGRVFGEGRAVAGLLTVGGRAMSVSNVVVACNTNRATIAGTIVNDGDGGNVAQILAGTSWDTLFLGEVVATNNVGEGEFDVEWINHDGYHFALPVCNFAAAVTRITAEGCYRRFVEANEPTSIPIDPYHHTARMLAGTFANGADNIAGWWMDTITAVPAGSHIDIVGANQVIDGSDDLNTWEPVVIDRDISLNLNGNSIVTVYTNDTFVIAEGVTAVVSNGTIAVGEDYEAFAGDTSMLKTNDVTVLKLALDDYGLYVDGVFEMLGDVMSFMGMLPSGTAIELSPGSDLTIDTAANAIVVGGVPLAKFADFRSVVPTVSESGGSTAYVLELNDRAVPEFGIDVNAVSSDGEVVVTLTGTHRGLYYAVQRKSSLVEAWIEPAAGDWQYVETEGASVRFSLPASESAGFYRVKVTEGDPASD